MFVIIRSDISYELSTVARRDKTLPISKTLPRTQKHFPRIQKQLPESEHTSQNPKYLVLESVLDHGTCFWILARIFGFWGNVFSWWGQKPPLKCLLKLNLRIFYISFHFLTKYAR